MNSQQLQASLYSATASTFEELALLCPSADLDVEQRQVPLTGGASVTFDGPLRGELVLSVTDQVLAAAASNMLGADDVPVAALQQDAMCELANVICGSLLPHVAGRRAIFRLGVPRWRGASDGSPASMTAFGAPVTEVLMGLEDGRVEVSLFLVNTWLSVDGVVP